MPLAFSPHARAPHMKADTRSTAAVSQPTRRPPAPEARWQGEAWGFDHWDAVFFQRHPGGAGRPESEASSFKESAPPSQVLLPSRTMFTPQRDPYYSGPGSQSRVAMYSTLLFYTVGVFTVAYVLGGQTLDFVDKATELKNWQVRLALDDLRSQMDCTRVALVPSETVEPRVHPHRCWHSGRGPRIPAPIGFGGLLSSAQRVVACTGGCSFGSPRRTEWILTTSDRTE